MHGKTIVFGDSRQHGCHSTWSPQLNKRHNALSCCKTRSSIAAKILDFIRIRGVKNPANVVSKHWDCPAVKNVLRPLLFWWGDTSEVAEEIDPWIRTTSTVVHCMAPACNSTITEQAICRESMLLTIGRNGCDSMMATVRMGTLAAV